MNYEMDDWTELSVWPEEPSRQDRFPLMRMIRFAVGAHLDPESEDPRPPRRDGSGLSVNVSNGGLCMLTSWAPDEGMVLRLEMPMPESAAKTPTLAQVRWVRALPAPVHSGYAVGLRFLL